MTTLADGRKEYSLPIRLHSGQTRTLKWFLDSRQLIDGSIIQHGVWEGASTNAVSRIVKPAMRCMDIGANMGYYTVLLAELGRSVVSVEAMHEPYELTCKHVEMNGLSNKATVHHAAMSSEDACRQLGKFFSNYSWPPALVQQQPEDVQITTLDWLLAKAHPGVSPDFLKIDVDGYEALVLEGASATLQLDKPIILLEVCDYTLQTIHKTAGSPYGQEVKKLLEPLVEIGYHFWSEWSLNSEISIDGILSSLDLSKQSVNVICSCGSKYW